VASSETPSKCGQKAAEAGVKAEAASAEPVTVAETTEPQATEEVATASN
jgi:hypothetical protein